MTPDTSPRPTQDSTTGERAYGLVGIYDDPEDPEEFTVYPADVDPAQLTSCWFSIDAECTVDIDSMR